MGIARQGMAGYCKVGQHRALQSSTGHCTEEQGTAMQGTGRELEGNAKLESSLIMLYNIIL